MIDHSQNLSRNLSIYLMLEIEMVIKRVSVDSMRCDVYHNDIKFHSTESSLNSCRYTRDQEDGQTLRVFQIQFNETQVTQCFRKSVYITFIPFLTSVLKTHKINPR